MPRDPERLNEIDRAILDLVGQRMEILRQENAAESPADVSARIESTVKQSAATHRIDPDRLRTLLRHVASLSNAELETCRIAYLGPQHSYSHLAAIKYFGDAASFTPETTIAAVFDAVGRGQAAMGIVPVENSTDGRVVDTLGMFVQTPVNICGEVLLPIHHYLLSRTPREQIVEIYSKPQALSQCRGWLAQHMPAAQLKELSSTAAAAKLAAEKPGVAAIASEAAGREYGLNVIAASIEDNPNNVTRFAVLGAHEPDSSGNDKTALVLQIIHRPGALADAMNVFKTHNLNLTWIESYPMPAGPNEYLFFVELEGHKQDAPVKAAIEDLKAFTVRRDILGSYPKDSNRTEG
ncbi:P-protein [Rosistilla carotiformis]|uniref:Bifunctional chorismate mutase/prephenate dehydratase n=1 Tax=Rosistilla carotiformis TaxID=2528017 RepID=A0A518JSR5_9BACT|nr:prephenate dehydratase [Rosistilla carotiformis]QDV68586.1 P-protein [Rosistilla carotiformis]